MAWGESLAPENVFQNLTMALTYAEGGLFTPTDLAGWLEEAGFGPARFQPIQAVRPMVLYVAQLNEEMAA